MIPGQFGLIMSSVLQFVLNWINRINMEMSSVKSFIFKGFKWKPASFWLNFFRLHQDRPLDKDKGKKRALGFAVGLGQPLGTASAGLDDWDF